VNFLGMGPMELMVILVIALIVVGPGKLPEMAGQVGRVIREFRRTTSELSSEFSRTLSLEVEERKVAEGAQPQAYAEPAPEQVYVAPEQTYTPPAPAYDASSTVAAAPAEPAEAPPAEAVEPTSSISSTSGSVKGKRTYDADLAPPY
jgi:sec-independent protein translocase protein TatB